jgi:hypothetical protein
VRAELDVLVGDDAVEVFSASSASRCIVGRARRMLASSTRPTSQAFGDASPRRS